jgi:hypothetical protein
MVPKGLDVTLTYIIVSIELLYSMILAFENIKNTKFKKYLPIFLIIFLLGISTIIQNIFPDLYLIASGGVSSMKDIEQLQEANVPAVITGKAIYEGKIKLNELSSFLS